MQYKLICRPKELAAIKPT